MEEDDLLAEARTQVHCARCFATQEHVEILQVLVDLEIVCCEPTGYLVSVDPDSISEV